MANVIIGDSIIRKKSVPVLLKLDNGTTITGHVFMSENQRLQDLVNGDRTFLPLKTIDDNGTNYLLLNKRFIVSVQETI